MRIVFLHMQMQGVSFEVDEAMVAEDEEREALQDIINNTKLNEGYLTLARDIEVMEPKSPEDIYKVRLSFDVTALSWLHLESFSILVYWISSECEFWPVPCPK